MAASVHGKATLVAAGVLAGAAAWAQDTSPTELRRDQALLQLDYQTVHVKGDQPIDLLGFHLLNQVGDGLYVGAGVFAPLFKGVYGGFTAWDITLHAQPRISERLFATAGLSAGGGAGGRSVEDSKTLSGTGGFYKAYAGLGYDLGPFTLGANVAKMKFRRSAIDGTQANVFVQVPFSYLSGPFARHGQPLSAGDAAQAAADTRERMLSVSFDHYSQRSPQGSFKGGFDVADLQFAQFFGADSYWFAGLGVGLKGMPLYNHVMGGLGQRWQLSPRLALYGQLGLGSGGYSPDKIDTDAGFLVNPRVSAEYALGRDLGLSLSAGVLVAPEGSSKNVSLGVALTRHLRGGAGAGPGQPAYQGLRVGLFQQTEPKVRYAGVDRGHVNMIGVQADAIVDEHWYLPLQAAVAYSTYLGYAGYGELLAGIGLQTAAPRGEGLQGFAELMAGTNVHGLGVKGVAGLRYGFSERLALRLAAGRFEARSASGNHFTANSVAVGLDYRFSLPTW